MQNVEETVYEKTTKIKEKVISNNTSDKMRYALENVVAKGSGSKLRIQ